MKLHAKVIVLLIALFAAYGAIDYAVQEYVILPSFVELEADLAHTDMQRVNHALDSESTALLTFCADWGNWMDVYRFMERHDPRFIEENMAQATIESANLQLVAYIGRDYHFVWRQGYSPTDFSPLSYQLIAGDTFKGEKLFRDAIDRGQQARGIINTERGPAIVAIAPVLDGAGNGPHRGAVMIGRLLTPELVAKLAEQAQVDLQMITPARSEFSEAARIVPLEKVNEVYRNVQDNAGRPILTFKIISPRAITERGKAAIRFVFVSLLVAGAGALIALLMGLRAMILRPVSRMTQHAVSIGESGDLTRRLSVNRQDELGLLAREFDRMLDRFSDARRRLVDKSFEAGLAEMASGVLHNVGNALTPVAVKTANIQQTLSELPASDLQMVLNELDHGVADASRRNDLQEFLRLATAENLKANQKISAAVKAIADGVLAIQAMLNDRALHAHGGGPVIEAVRLDELVRQALLLVPPQRLSTVEVSIEDSVTAVGTVLLARVTMQQVFQNLIVNACEAMPASLAGAIKVSARVTGRDGERKLQVTFSDNGAGIAPEHLSTIFNKGFTTKPLENNSGLGLHWSANVVAALGGQIRAESPGPNGGAVFHITLPMQKTSSDSGALAA